MIFGLAIVRVAKIEHVNSVEQVSDLREYTEVAEAILASNIDIVGAADTRIRAVRRVGVVAAAVP